MLHCSRYTFAPSSSLFHPIGIALFLCNLLVIASCAHEKEYVASPTFSATKTEKGVLYEYFNDNGHERLRVVGHVNNDFDPEHVMADFRTILSQNMEEHTRSNTPSPTVKQKSLWESFSEFMSGSPFTFNIQRYYNEYTYNEYAEQLAAAKRELAAIENDLSKVQTQKVILSKRQSELGVWLRENAQQQPTARNPTVEELVNTESDRLALLEHRLQRLENELNKQRSDANNYINMHDRAKGREGYKESRIFTKKPSGATSQVIISETKDSGSTTVV